MSRANKADEACCYYALCKYTEAEEEAKKGPEGSALRTRLLFHTAHKRNDEGALPLVRALPLTVV
eukprot:4276671-Amphidinium_carterae.2